MARDNSAAEMRKALQYIAPGTELREALNRIRRSHTGALIVLGYSHKIASICSGGFKLDVELSAARLRELCKMDGAVIIDVDNWHIRHANAQLLPKTTLPTSESGMRHRTAERTAQETGLPVISLSSSMRSITIYVGDSRHTVEEPEILLPKAKLAIDTLERYCQHLDKDLRELTTLELNENTTIRNVAIVMQRMEMIRRITSEINGYLEELGSAGRLVALQVDDLIRGSASERALVLRDYVSNADDLAVAEKRLSDLDSESLVNLADIANVLGMSVFTITDLDRNVQPRGIRALSTVPQLPWSIVLAISQKWFTLSEILKATVEDLQQIEGIGPYRAQTIKNHLESQYVLSTQQHPSGISDFRS